MIYDAIFIYPPINEGKKTVFSFPPLGILYISTYVIKKGFDVKVIDAVINNIPIKDLVDQIVKEKPGIVCISAMTPQILNSIRITEDIKAQDPDIKIAIGGSHISSTKDSLYRFSKNFDFLIYGEGEFTFYELLKSLKDNSNNFNEINGLIYKDKEGKVVINPPREPIEDLNSIPFPDLSLVDIKKYESFYAKSHPFTTLIASRGCPFNCTFCDAYATHGKRLRFRSPGNIVDEIENNLKKFGIRQIMIKDSTFTVDKGWVKEICNLIISRGLKINWTCNTRVDMIEKELFKLMKKAGCYMVLLGIESGSQKVLDNIRKGITLKQIEEGIKICKEVDIETTGYFMIGNQGDSEVEVRKTINLSKKLNLDFVNFGVATPYPNTELYNWAVEKNYLDDKDWYMKETKFLANQVLSSHIHIPELPIEKQIELCKKANKEFYFRPGYIISQVLKLRPSNFRRKFSSMLELLN